MSRPVLHGKTVSFRLPLATDSTLRGQADAAGVSAGRFAARAVVRDMSAVEDHAVTVTVTMSARLFAALEETGALTVVEEPERPSATRLAAAPRPLDPADPRIPEHLAPRVERAQRRQREAERIPGQDELDAKGGVGEVEGCEHKHSVAVGALRRCAVCKAFRGLDGVWRAG